MTRNTSALMRSCGKLRALWDESTNGKAVVWTCRVCGYTYQEALTGHGWPLSVGGLSYLAEHMEGHTVS